MVAQADNVMVRVPEDGRELDFVLTDFGEAIDCSNFDQFKARAVTMDCAVFWSAQQRCGRGVGRRDYRACRNTNDCYVAWFACLTIGLLVCQK